MTLNLNASLQWTATTAAQKTALADLQGNILKGHGREHTVNTFIQLDPADRAGNRTFVRALGASVTNALGQLTGAAAFRAAKRAGKKAKASGPFVALFLSATGYQKLGIAAAKTPADAKFRAGLKGSQAGLNDPPTTNWDKTFRGDVDLMLLVGEQSAAAARSATNALLSTKPASIKVLGEEIGVAYKNDNDDGVEHFGYVDGRSQPLMLREDVERDPEFPLKTALVPDPGGGASSFGSYFVFRKLEQNVEKFKAREDALAKALGLKGEDAERAGAMVVGRFEDGTPVVLQQDAGMHNPVPNNFNYDDDPDGNKCPFQGHVRKSNPRGDSVRKSGVPLADERSHIMARRGITYGKRRRKGKEFSDKPTGDVGLLFMAYQSDIARQFEFTQMSWVNSPGFVAAGTGVDPVIGQGPATTPHWPTEWGDQARKDFGFQGFVTMKGGEYFFAPAISVLTSLT
jgi:Dyp-type peroxidase family